MEKISLTEVLQICEQYNTDTSQKATEAFNDLLHKLVVKEYLTTTEKAVAITKILLKTDSLYINISEGFMSLGLDIELIIDGLLRYTNIDVDNLPEEIRCFSTLDILLMSGLDSYILQYCERDYKRLEKQVERAISFSNLNNLFDAMEHINPKDVDYSINKVQEMMTKLDKEQVMALRDICAFNDPNLFRVKEQLDETSFEQILRMDKLEKLNKK